MKPFYFKGESMMSFIKHALLPGLILATAVQAAEPTYPLRAVKIVVPWTAGQATDVAARNMATALAAALNQPFVVDNKPGAGGALGSDFVAKSAPDGYTLLAGSTGSVTVNPLVSRTPYDAASFVPAGFIATVPYVLVTAPGFPARDVNALIAMLKAHPGKYTFASSGNGSIGHLIGELFVANIGAKVTHVPYKGSSGALLDVMAGRVDFMFDSVSSVLPHLKSERIRAYGLSSARRSAALPGVGSLASVAELRDFDLFAWIGLMAPAGTPVEVTQKLNREMQEATAGKALREHFRNLGIEPVDGMSVSAAARLLADERARLGALIRSANIQAD